MSRESTCAHLRLLTTVPPVTIRFSHAILIVVRACYIVFALYIGLYIVIQNLDDVLRKYFLNKFDRC